MHHVLKATYDRLQNYIDQLNNYLKLLDSYETERNQIEYFCDRI
ncbi:hypothetical protein LSO9J_260003 [Candidatus Liberibacter solanacearum]